MGHNIHIKKETAIYAVCLAVLFCLFAWRQFFGFNKNDEIFYISTVYRFFQGDAMLVDDNARNVTVSRDSFLENRYRKMR